MPDAVEWFVVGLDGREPRLLPPRGFGGSSRRDFGGSCLGVVGGDVSVLTSRWIDLAPHGVDEPGRNNFGFTNAAVVGMLRCGAVNSGPAGLPSPNDASNGKSASGTWDAGTWSGTFRAPPAIVVTPARNLVDAQAVQVRARTSPAAQMAMYDVPRGRVPQAPIV